MRRYFFITYGTSEFYTKRREKSNGLHTNGPFAAQFQHITLDRMIKFVQCADGKLSQCDDSRREWLKMMKLEKKKRKSATRLLKKFSNFRKAYLELQDFEENDFPRNRFLYCGPERAFPAKFEILKVWNSCEKYRQHYGQLELFPVGRRTPSIHDSVLHFCDLKFTNHEKTLKIYMEVNEDFNLNIKITWEREFGEDLREPMRERIQCMLNSAKWPHDVRTNDRNYIQGNQVIFKLDFGFLENIEDKDQVICNLSETAKEVKRVLRGKFNARVCTA